MNDLNCPSCGTTYQSLKAGVCDCCGFEFTSDYINKIISEEKKQEKIVQQKIAEENRQRKLLLDEEEKEKRKKAKAEKKSKEEADKSYKKEKKDREKIMALVDENNKRYEKELKFSLLFKNFRGVMATLGIIFVLISIVVSVAFSDELGVSFITPQSVILNKVETIYQELTIPVELDEEKYILKKKKETEAESNCKTF